MRNTMHFRLFQGNTSLIENVQNSTKAFEVKKMPSYLEHEPLELLCNAYQLGIKIFKNFPELSENNVKYKNIVLKKDIFERIQTMAIEKKMDRIIPYIKEFEQKYLFQVLTPDEYVEFSKQIIIFSLLYSYNHYLILIKNNKANYLKREDSKIPYIEDKLNTYIDNLNNLGNILFEHFDEIHTISTDDLDYLLSNKIQISTKKYKTLLLHAVNEFSSKFSYTISSFVDVKSRTVSFASDKVFNLIWHIFVNFVIADVLPEKITFCLDCGEMIENTTKNRKLCKKCQNKSRNRKSKNNKKTTN